ADPGHARDGRPRGRGRRGRGRLQRDDQPVVPQRLDVLATRRVDPASPALVIRAGAFGVAVGVLADVVDLAVRLVQRPQAADVGVGAGAGVGAGVGVGGVERVEAVGAAVDRDVQAVGVAVAGREAVAGGWALTLTG